MTEVVPDRDPRRRPARLPRASPSALPPGAVVLLTGDLGAGKTAFVRGMAAGLGIDPEDISSPTFTLIQEYRPSTRSAWPGPVAESTMRVLSHVDLYRLEGAEVDDLGLDELSAGGGVVAIEWAEKLASPPHRTRSAWRSRISG